MTGKPCCCGESCVRLDDDFSGEHEDPPDSNWVVYSGTWEYTGLFALEELGTADAVLATVEKTSHSDMHVSTYALEQGKPRVLLAVVDDDDYLYVEVDFVNEDIILGAVSSGTPAVLKTVPFEFAAEGVNIQACYTHHSSQQDGLLYVRISDTGDELLQWVSAPAVGTGKHAGLGNGGSTTVQFFDEFEFTDHLLHADPPDPQHCPKCMCTCGGKYPPSTLTGTWWDAGDEPGTDDFPGGCPELDGVSFEWNINHEDTDPLEYVHEWPYECSWCDFYGSLDCNWDGETWGDDPCEAWTLNADEVEQGCWDRFAGMNPDVCTCDPYYFRFNGLLIDWGGEGSPKCCTGESAMLDLEFEE